MRSDLSLLAGFLLSLLACGCGERARSNPFDPANPVTGGRPADFEAIAGNGQVRLQWKATTAPGLLGYQLYRKLALDTAYTAITGTIPAAASQIGDFSLANGLEHDYRLYYVFDRGLGTLYAEDIATPGNLEPWVADYGHSAAARLTPDGRHIDYSVPFSGPPLGFGAPLDVAADPANGFLWVSTESAALVRYTPSTTTRLVLQPPFEPGALGLDPVNGNVWVCDGADNTV
ncbi:MAG: hypothetical protein ACRENS_11235, partial [Candidatus Eiseniibacteriota bacterium]